MQVQVVQPKPIRPIQPNIVEKLENDIEIVEETFRKLKIRKLKKKLERKEKPKKRLSPKFPNITYGYYNGVINPYTGEWSWYRGKYTM